MDSLDVWKLWLKDDDPEVYDALVLKPARRRHSVRANFYQSYGIPYEALPDEFVEAKILQLNVSGETKRISAGRPRPKLKPTLKRRAAIWEQRRDRIVNDREYRDAFLESRRPAQAMETQRAETTGSVRKHDSAVNAPK